MMHEGVIYFLGNTKDLAETQDPIVRNFVDRNSFHDVAIEGEIERLQKSVKQ
jgi:ABC-type transporter Mla maintaining outer membrane lipid asymmetry ATPase subunit MlaF